MVSVPALIAILSWLVPACINSWRVEKYLRARAADAKYDQDDFDSLSNKLISRLVIRAN